VKLLLFGRYMVNFYGGIGSFAGYIGEAMDEPPLSLAFVMVKESFVIPAIFFYLESAANKNNLGDNINTHKFQLPLKNIIMLH
jgi:hypothetical protein